MTPFVVPSTVSFGPGGVRPVFALFGLWAALTHRVWLLGETYFLRDFWVNYVPARQMLREAWANGHLGVWNNRIGGGLPVAPDVNNSLFYVPGWAFLLFEDQAWSLSFCVDLHLLLAALGTYAVTRRFAGPWASVTAGAAFGFGGLMTSNVINVQLQFAYAWAPLWLYSLLRLFDSAPHGRREALRWAAVLGLVWAAQLTASDPQIVYQEGLASGVGALVFAVGGRLRGRGLAGSLVLLSAAALAGVLAAAPQIAALAEALGETTRGAMTEAGAIEWSLHPLRLVELLLPLPFGHVVPSYTFWGERLVSGPWSNFYFYGLYAGTLAVPLLACGLRWNDRATRVILAAVALWVLAAMGSSLPVYAILRRVLPLWEAFRYPERLLVLPALLGALAMARGVDRLNEHLSCMRGATVTVLVVSVATAVASLLVGPAIDERVFGAVLASAAQSVPVLTAALVLLRLAVPARRVALLALLVSADVVVAGMRTAATWETPALEPPPVSTEGRVLFPLGESSEAAGRLPLDARLRRGLEDSVARPNIGAARGIRFTNAVTSLDLRRAALLRGALGPLEAARRYGTTHVIASSGTRSPVLDPGHELPGGLTAFALRGATPAVACYGQWTPVSSPQAAAEVVRSGGVALESSLAPDPGADQVVPCSLLRAGPGRFDVLLERVPHPTLVRVAESTYPGWRVRGHLDSYEPALVADVAFLGVVAPPATALVELRFEPPWLRGSLALMPVSLMSLLALAIWRRGRAQVGESGGSDNAEPGPAEHG